MHHAAPCTSCECRNSLLAGHGLCLCAADRDNFLGPEQAIALGLIDGVIA